MPSTKRAKRCQPSPSSSSGSLPAFSTSEDSAASSDFSSSSSSDGECSHPHASHFAATDDCDVDVTNSYDSARLAFVKKIRREHEALAQRSPTYASSHDLSAAVDVAASKISSFSSASELLCRSDSSPCSRSLFPHQQVRHWLMMQGEGLGLGFRFLSQITRTPTARAALVSGALCLKLQWYSCRRDGSRQNNERCGSAF
jgi:hypothetical protein